MKIKRNLRQNLQKIRYFNKFYGIHTGNKVGGKIELASKIIKRSLVRTLRPLEFDPSILQIEIATKCNLDCWMCDRANRLNEYEINQSMSYERYKELVKKHPNLLAIYLSGLGEPLLNSDLTKMIKFNSAKGIFSYMITNGLLLNENMYRELVKAGLGWLTISLDSIKNYSEVRKGGRFDVLNDNIDTVMRLRKEGYFVLTSFTVTVTNENVSEIEEIITYGMLKGVDKIYIQDVQTNPRVKASNTITESEYLSLKKMAESYGNAIEIELMFNRFSRMNRCTRPWEVAYYSVTGDYLFCCYTDKRISFGNIYDDGFQKCNENIRGLLLDLKQERTPEICSRCTLVVNT